MFYQGVSKYHGVQYWLLAQLVLLDGSGHFQPSVPEKLPPSFCGTAPLPHFKQQLIKTPWSREFLQKIIPEEIEEGRVGSGDTRKKKERKKDWEEGNLSRENGSQTESHYS